MSLLAPALLAAAPALAPAQEPPPQDPSSQEPATQDPPARDHELLHLWIADLETFFTDPKDRRLLETLRLVDDRVLELQDEIPAFRMPVPPAVVRLGLHLVTGEKSLRILSSTDPNLMFGVYGQLELMEHDPEKARAIAESLAAVARDAGAPLGQPREDGLVPVEGASVPVLFGARGGEVVLSAGKVIEEPIDLSGLPLPQDARPTLVAHVDVGGILGLVRPLAAQDVEGAMLYDMLDELGLTDLEVDLAAGMDAERSYTHVTVPGFAGHLRGSGLMPARPLTARDVALVPKDAVWASVGTVDFQGLLDFCLAILEEPLAEKGIEDPIEQLAAASGFHLRADLFDHLGAACGMYTSDTTGGGGLLSTVVFVELSDPNGMLDTTERVQDVLNGLAEAEAEGYVELRSWDQGGTSYLTLTFPGLPVPAEPTLAFTNHHLFAALTPTACAAAVAQAKGEGPSLLDHPRFRENLPSPVEGAYSVSFYDTPRYLGDGYGLTNLLCSALVNGTRSRTDATRDARMIMPAYHDLVEGAKASVGVTRVEGDDLVSETRGDRSALVNLTSTVGFLAETPLLLALPAAAGWGVAESAESAEYIEDF